MISAVSMFTNSFNHAQSQQKENLINQRYNEIYSHELAHQMAGGHLAGGIVIEKDSNGIPIGGHVSIQMPALDKKNPDKTIQDADTVIRSAMAPGDPSDQDYRVANQAREIKSRAISYKNSHPQVGNKLNTFA